MPNRSMLVTNNATPSALPISLTDAPGGYVFRRTIRVAPAVDQPIRVDVNGDDFIEVLEATDISSGGLGVVVPHGFEGCNLNGLVSLIVQLPYPVNEYVSVMGQVIHLDKTRFGISFVGVNRAVQGKIQAYINYRCDDRSSWLHRLGHWFGV